MKINDTDVSIEDLVTDLKPYASLRQHYNGNIYLSDNDIEVLNKYNFNISNYSNLNSLIFDIQEYLDENYDMELDDLEKLSISLAETNYYQNTNK